jgi:hypothetical protein
MSCSRDVPRTARMQLPEEDVFRLLIAVAGMARGHRVDTGFRFNLGLGALGVLNSVFLGVVVVDHMCTHVNSMSRSKLPRHPRAKSCPCHCKGALRKHSKINKESVQFYLRHFPRRRAQTAMMTAVGAGNNACRPPSSRLRTAFRL